MSDLELPVFYWSTSHLEKAGLVNLGDHLTIPLLSRMGIRAIPYDSKKHSFCFLGCGTILNMLNKIHAKKIVAWGSGVCHERINPREGTTLVPIAVRGPLTAERLGMPELPLGDPGILCREFMDINPTPNGDLVVTHWRDEYPGAVSMAVPPEKSGEVIARIAGAQFVWTSSLHGAILAQSYGVPWAMRKGEGSWKEFWMSTKWKDWLMSLGLSPEEYCWSENIEAGKAWWEKISGAIKEPDRQRLTDALHRWLQEQK